jgi:hypothetical protein
MKTTIETTEARIFLTDYASYNNGTQFEFGHWVDLSDFSSANELNEYIENHFAEADEKSPLDSPREEIMITDFEGFPKALYSESSMNFEALYEYLNLEDDDKIKVSFIIEQGESLEYAMGKYEDIYLTEWYENFKYDMFEMYYPEAEKSINNCDYAYIDYDRFVKECFTEFDYDGTTYYIDSNWNS